MNYTKLINKTEDYIEAHLSEKISLKELAKNVYLSEFHFHRIFKEHSKETLKQFITRIKMERSGIYLVVNPKITVTEIAYRYGYSDVSAYNRAFKNHFGTTPTLFRLKKQQEFTSQ